MLKMEEKPYMFLFVLLSGDILWILGLYTENVHRQVQHHGLAWLIFTCCNQVSDLIKTHIVFQGSIKKLSLSY